MMNKGLEYEFEQLSRTKKCEFISQHVELASPEAIAKYVKGYLLTYLKMLVMMSMSSHIFEIKVTR